jgi:hypothetical protein
VRIRFSLFVAWALGLSTLAGCLPLMDGGGIKGSGILKAESRRVAEFSSIRLESVGTITVRQTGKESLTVSAEDNLLPLLESRVADRTLILGVAHGKGIRPTKPIEYTVEVKSLEGIRLQGAGNIDAKDIRGRSLSVSLSGAGNVTITGSADALDLTLSGAGNYHGEDFKTSKATIHSSGVGNAIVNVTKELDATLSGVGTVEYIGSPHVRTSVSGIGTVKQR